LKKGGKKFVKKNIHQQTPPQNNSWNSNQQVQKNSWETSNNNSWNKQQDQPLIFCKCEKGGCVRNQQNCSCTKAGVACTKNCRCLNTIGVTCLNQKHQHSWNSNQQKGNFQTKPTNSWDSSNTWGDTKPNQTSNTWGKPTVKTNTKSSWSSQNPQISTTSSWNSSSGSQPSWSSQSSTTSTWNKPQTNTSTWNSPPKTTQSSWTAPTIQENSQSWNNSTQQSNSWNSPSQQQQNTSSTWSSPSSSWNQPSSSNNWNQPSTVNTQETKNQPSWNSSNSSINWTQPSTKIETTNTWTQPSSNQDSWSQPEQKSTSWNTPGTNIWTSPSSNSTSSSVFQNSVFQTNTSSVQEIGSILKVAKPEITEVRGLLNIILDLKFEGKEDFERFNKRTLSDDELKQFRLKEFQLGEIPEVPPPDFLCSGKNTTALGRFYQDLMPILMHQMQTTDATVLKNQTKELWSKTDEKTKEKYNKLHEDEKLLMDKIASSSTLK
jgi:hypothetical protein